MIFVCSRWSNEDSPVVEDSLKGPSVGLTTSNDYGSRKSLQTKFEGVVDYDFKNKLEAIEEEDEEKQEEEPGRQLEDEAEHRRKEESQERGDDKTDEFDKDIENSLTMDLEEDLREEDNNTHANNTRFQVRKSGLPPPGHKRQIFPINKVKGVGLALILGRRGMSRRLQRTSRVRSPIKH